MLITRIDYSRTFEKGGTTKKKGTLKCYNIVWDFEFYTVYTIPNEQNKIYNCMNLYYFIGRNISGSGCRTGFLKMVLYAAMILG